MKTIHAIYENGVFRPTEPVDLPDGSEVTVEPRGVGPAPGPPDYPDEAGLDAIYEVLSHRHATGETDLAARHNDHQP